MNEGARVIRVSNCYRCPALDIDVGRAGKTRVSCQAGVVFAGVLSKDCPSLVGDGEDYAGEDAPPHPRCPMRGTRNVFLFPAGAESPSS